MFFITSLNRASYMLYLLSTVVAYQRIAVFFEPSQMLWTVQLRTFVIFAIIYRARKIINITHRVSISRIADAVKVKG